MTWPCITPFGCGASSPAAGTTPGSRTKNAEHPNSAAAASAIAPDRSWLDAVLKRDLRCVYCRCEFGVERAKKRSWEHIINDETIATVENIALCCVGCNASKGAKESRQDHDGRLLTALEERQVHCWPYPGAVGLLERFEDVQQVHVIQHWHYLGSAATVEEARGLVRSAPGFDADGYKILCKPLLAGRHHVELL